MWFKSLILVTFMALYCGSAHAAEVVKWVDEDGVTHFGNPQFAPPAEGETVSLQPANGMAVPDTSRLPAAKRSGRQVVTLKKPEKKNRRGWRGYRSQRAHNSGYRG